MSRTLYNKKLNLEFYHIPKNGMTTVIHGIGGFKWVDPAAVPKNATTFCVLRDPFLRAVSSFDHFAFSDRFKNIPEQSIRNLSEDKLADFVRRGFTKYGFDSFIKEIENNGIFNEHHRPQVGFLEGNKNKNPTISSRKMDNIDLFLKHKNLSEGLSEIMGVKIPHLNKGYSTPTGKTKILEFAQDQIGDRIKDLYEEDFKIYNKYIKQ